MKSILVREFGEPEVMRLEEAADPRPGPGEVLIRVKTAGVNPVDVYIRAGKYAVKPGLPYTPGLDAAGVVEKVGEGVACFKPGDRVYTSNTSFGSYAELMVSDQRRVYPLPDNTGFVQGASLGVPYATAYRALFQKAGAKAGESVLVHGATGGVGIAAVQLARAHGMRVIGTGGTEEGRALAMSRAATAMMDNSDGLALSLSDLSGVSRVGSPARGRTRDRGFDVVDSLAVADLARALGGPRHRFCRIGICLDAGGPGGFSVAGDFCGGCRAHCLAGEGAFPGAFAGRCDRLLCRAACARAS